MGGAAKTSPGQAASSIPLPTIITWAGSWPDPEPCTIDTLSSRGASLRMMRLYSGTYFSVSGFASAMPSSISGTYCWGSLTNFFIPRSPSSLPLGTDALGEHGQGHGAGVDGSPAALAGVGGAAPLRDHVDGGVGGFPGRGCGGGERGGGLGARLQLLLERVGERRERVEQGLVAEVGLAARLDALDRRAEHRDDLVAGERLRVAGRHPRAHEPRAPDRAGGAADP